MLLPQEIKDRIYYFSIGDQVIHLDTDDNEENHVHGGPLIKLSHCLCQEPTSEVEAQGVFDSADPNVVQWEVSEIQDRHADCYGTPYEDGTIPNPNKISLTLLRTCRQIYLEASQVVYTKNTFAINSNEVLERFFSARFKNKQHSAIRTLILDFGIIHAGDMTDWSDSIAKVGLQRLKSVQRLYLYLGQNYCYCSVEGFRYDGTEMKKRQGLILKQFAKLGLLNATLFIDDSGFMERRSSLMTEEYQAAMEQKFRWTFKQKQDFSKAVTDVLLRRGTETQ